MFMNVTIPYNVSMYMNVTIPYNVSMYMKEVMVNKLIQLIQIFSLETCTMYIYCNLIVDSWLKYAEIMVLCFVSGPSRYTMYHG